MIKLKVSDLLIDAKRWKNDKKGHTVGWVVNYHGKEYGDYVIITDELIDSVLKECAFILGQQMNATMFQVVYKEFVEDTKLGWEEFSQTMMELRGSVKDSIKILKE